MLPLLKFKHLGSVSREYQFRCFPVNYDLYPPSNVPDPNSICT
ncbi:hypothetical protein T05_6983 [Trichinella murrelli]|uniref:Uncharacterized protein n=1 Tax=Trichinella murrelli TaxID=144512 RepID=A0A0V0SYY6_9BILA|nr:hypothetical protein T05_6983 [Trichinella murrelli]